MKNVLVVIPVEQRHKEKLEAAGKGCRFIYTTKEAVTDEQVAAADAIIGNVPAAKIHASQRLGLLQLNSAGTEGYVTPGVLAPGTMLTNSTGAYGQAVAEHCLTMALMLQKKLQLYRDNQKAHRWEDCGNVTSICGKTVLVVGLGDIGLYFAKLAKVLGAHTIGLKRRPGACPEGVDELYLTDQLDEVLPRADVVASFLPGTPATTHLYTKERFELMKPTAVFINGGRGSAVALDVLYEALHENLIHAAGVDVLEQEPLAEDSPLWNLPNLMITPHISGNFHLQETFERIVDIAAGNLKAWLEGAPLHNLVDFTTGYKK